QHRRAARLQRRPWGGDRARPAPEHHRGDRAVEDLSALCWPPMPDPGPAIDVLSDVLATARLHSRVLGRGDPRPPWALAMKDQPRSVFHLVLEGSCFLKVGSGKARAAQRGDVLLIPRGQRHVLRDSEQSRLPPVELSEWRPPPNGDG